MITASRSSVGAKGVPSIWARCGLSFQLSFCRMSAPFGPCNSITGSCRTWSAGTLAATNDGPMPRMITGLEAFPVMMNPAIITRSPVSTRKRVEIFKACAAGVGLGDAGAVAVGVAVAVAVAVGVAVAVAVAVAVGVGVGGAAVTVIVNV